MQRRFVAITPAPGFPYNAEAPLFTRVGVRLSGLSQRRNG